MIQRIQVFGRLFLGLGEDVICFVNYSLCCIVLEKVPILQGLLLLVLLEFILHFLTINTLFIYVFRNFTYKFFVFIHVSLIVTLNYFFFIFAFFRHLLLIGLLVLRRWLSLTEDGVLLLLEVVIKFCGVVFNLSFEPVEVHVHIPILLDCHMFVQLLLSLLYYFVYLLHSRSFGQGAEEFVLNPLLGPQGLLIFRVSQVLLLLLQHVELLLHFLFVLGYLVSLTFGVIVSHVQRIKLVHGLTFFHGYSLLLFFGQHLHPCLLYSVQIRGGNLCLFLLNG